ncbi:MAG: hypothetical protein AVDCRST_MAG57-3244, partial [uncultured Blastococcus sp.]
WCWEPCWADRAFCTSCGRGPMGGSCRRSSAMRGPGSSRPGLRKSARRRCWRLRPRVGPAGGLRQGCWWRSCRRTCTCSGWCPAGRCRWRSPPCAFRCRCRWSGRPCRWPAAAR